MDHQTMGYGSAMANSREMEDNVVLKSRPVLPVLQ